MSNHSTLRQVNAKELLREVHAAEEGLEAEDGDSEAERGKLAYLPGSSAGLIENKARYTLRT